ncbi:MAG: heme ABC transporter permease [Alphaproteobacteria bacterium]|tara:strand:- start:57 stop:773 length:717 start_codon:yes stop_codon:yes gene_type:complete
MFTKFANPSSFQKLSDFLYKKCLIFSLVLVIIGLYYSFFNSPPDYLQGETVRIMYIHVPCAWFSLFTYTLMAGCSFFSLVFRHTLADIISRACAPVGACFTLATLITGSIWGKPTWGTWWVWDARLTSELVLFFIYIGHIFISNAYDDKRKGDRFAAILTLVGIINLPIIKWSVDWWNTLHQTASISKFSAPSIDTSMIVPLFFMAFSFFFFFISLVLLRVKGEIISRKIDVIEFSNN